jgi:hypothetical protein
MAVLKPLVPAKTLKLQVKVQDVESIGEINVGKATIVSGAQVHGKVEVVEGI